MEICSSLARITWTMNSTTQKNEYHLHARPIVKPKLDLDILSGSTYKTGLPYHVFCLDEGASNWYLVPNSELHTSSVTMFPLF